ncbi:MAG: DUF2231 domain-containing protein [Casimicrobiaceae bacterium]
MRTPASIGKHPLHPMLVSIPIGLWMFSLACDLIGARTIHPDLWFVLGLYTMIAGTLGAVLAAIPGLIDLLSLSVPRHRRIALLHMALNVAIIAMYLGNVWMRVMEPTRTGPARALSIAAILILLVSGWLGGSLVHVHGVSVDVPPLGPRD